MPLLPPHWFPTGGFFSCGSHPCLGSVAVSFIFRCYIYGESPKECGCFRSVWRLQGCCRLMHLQSHLRWAASCAALPETSGKAAFVGGHTPRHEPRVGAGAAPDVVMVSSSCSESMMLFGFIRPPENTPEWWHWPELNWFCTQPGETLR